MNGMIVRLLCVVRPATPVITALLLSGVAQAASDTHDRLPPSPAIQELRRHFNDAGINALTFHSIDSIFETVPVKAGGTVWPLARAETHPDFTYDFGGKSHAFEEIFDRNYTNALLIIKNDRIVFERYRNYTKPSTHFLSMSMSKSLTSILVGAALEDGYIKSLDDQIVAYVPALRGTAYDGVTIRDALLMKSGVDQEDNYQPEPGSEMAKLREDSMILNTVPSLKQAFLVKRADEPGKTFRYLTLNTAVLGQVIEKAVGKPIAQYMSERIWKPLGAEADAFWMADGPPGVGTAMNGMGYNATMRDYARVGLMMLHEGKANGRRIIPAAWVKESTVPVGPEPASPKEDQGYQYQWWTLVNSNAYMAIGLQGQFIYIDPDTATVVVKLSYFPLSNSDAYKESEAFFRAVSAWKPK
ncbi:MAG TPA: serine hydrolase [Sphingomonadaceae bacterium]|nr:serine hydrolase [Sphingomonadaceae bacterium]